MSKLNVDQKQYQQKELEKKPSNESSDDSWLCYSMFFLVYDNCPYQCPKPYLSYHIQKKNNRWSIVYEMYQTSVFERRKKWVQNVENGN